MKLTYPNWLGITAEYPALILGKANAEKHKNILAILYILITKKCFSSSLYKYPTLHHQLVTNLLYVFTIVLFIHIVWLIYVYKNKKTLINYTSKKETLFIKHIRRDWLRIKAEEAYKII